MKHLKNIKILIAGAAVVAAGVAGYLTFLESRHPAKYYALEPMTKTRPARFEDLKWKPEPGVDVRAPASSGK